jgi:hypothetical protein
MMKLAWIPLGCIVKNSKQSQKQQQPAKKKIHCIMNWKVYLLKKIYSNFNWKSFQENWLDNWKLIKILYIFSIKLICTHVHVKEDVLIFGFVIIYAIQFYNKKRSSVYLNIIREEKHVWVFNLAIYFLCNLVTQLPLCLKKIEWYLRHISKFKS